MSAPEAAEASLLDGLYYGALLALAVYNVVVWATLRERVYLYYVGLVMSLAFSSFAWDGLALGHLWPGAEGWNRASLVVLDAVAAVFVILFARGFLATPENAPRLDRWLLGVAALSIASIPLSGPGTWVFGLELMGVVSLVGPGLLLLAGVNGWRAGFPPARPYLLAMGGLLAGLLVEVGADYAVSRAPAWTEYGTYAGVLVMSVVFSQSLARRHRDALRERDRLEARSEALELASSQDGLTGVWNRRRFDGHLARVWSTAEREDGVVALLLVDVDFFKPYNDTYGHPEGDACLRRVAAALSEVAGAAQGLVARYGGEEFVAVLPDRSSEAAHRVGEAMRGAVAELAIPHEASTVAPHVTISVGVACLAPEDHVGPKQLVDAADGALYEAKGRGRNRVCSAA